MAMERPRDPDLAARLFGSSPERALTLMRAAWPAAVGPELARRTELLALDSGVLRIRVPDATWRRGLWRMRGDILARLRSIAGQAAPRSLGFVEGAAAEPPVVLAAAPAVPPAVASAAAPAVPASVVLAANSIGDADLRARFLAAAGHYFGRFASSGERSGPSGT
jgi:hypothetical protein